MPSPWRDDDATAGQVTSTGSDATVRAGYAGGAHAPGREPRNPRLSGPFGLVRRGFPVVELRGFEPLTFSLRTRRATNCATAPRAGYRLTPRRTRSRNRG